MPDLLAPKKIGRILIAPKQFKQLLTDPAAAREEATAAYFKKRASQAHQQAEKADLDAEKAYDEYISAQMLSKLKPGKRTEAKATHAALKVGDKDEKAHSANQRADDKFVRAHGLPPEQPDIEWRSGFDEQA